MKFEVEKTGTTPHVLLDTETSVFRIEGRSLAENAVAFYGEIIDWMLANLSHSGVKGELVLRMYYCNTSSHKGVVMVLRTLDKLNETGCSFSVKWLYEEDDEDWLEDGETFQELINSPFVMESFPHSEEETF